LEQKNNQNYGGKKMAADISTGLIAIGSGLAIGLSAIAAAIAEKEIGAAAVGAMAEKEELFGKGLILTVIPETLVIFGLVVAILILNLAQGA
jgi:V/A-type H+-transporting ATPase subunit K